MKLSVALTAMVPLWLSSCVTSTTLSCPANLGPELSEGTTYLNEYPALGSVNSPKGYDDTIGLLIGGSYTAPNAAEIEGAVVVLGDFTIGSAGTNSIGKVGVGSGIIPSFGSTYMTVGGNIDGGRTNGETWFPAGAIVEYGGQCVSNPRNKRGSSNYPDAKACGSMYIPDLQDPGNTGNWPNGNWVYIFKQTTIDTAKYQNMIEEAKIKSEFWYNLPTNGVIYRNNQASWDRNWRFKAGDSSCTQVFHIDYNMLQMMRSNTWGEFHFESSLKNKAIIINVSPFDNNGNLLDEVYFTGLSRMIDGNGQDNYNFAPSMIKTMLWNFYKTPKLVLGPKPNTNGSQLQFEGSIVIASGGLDFHYVGQNGRVIVGGDVLHDKQGSEFHNYEFDPPCDIPVPTTCKKGGGAAGDPHIKRWGRKPFEFHGECDLVLLHSDHVNGDKSFDVHIRTTIYEHWSQIESAAMKVGNDVLQVDIDKIYVNGVQYSDDDLPIKTDEFTVTEPVREENDRLYVITLTDLSTVSFKIVDNFMNFFVSGSEADFGEANGLMGTYHHGKPYGRAGTKIDDLHLFAMDWQVNPEFDPILFVENREPQLPFEQCRMPSVSKKGRRQLRASHSGDFIKDAENACANKSEYDSCLNDVLNTGSLALSRAW